MKVFYQQNSEHWVKCGRRGHWVFIRSELTPEQIKIIEDSCPEIVKGTTFYCVDAMTCEKVLASEYGVGRAKTIKAHTRKAGSPNRFATRQELNAFLRERDVVRYAPIVLGSVEN